MVLPDPLLYVDGTPVEPPGAPALGLAPFDGYSEAGDFRLGLISALAPEHAQRLIPLLAGAFAGGTISVTPTGLVFKVKELETQPEPLKAEGKPVRATRGGIYFDGKGQFLVFLKEADTPGKGWQLVGKAILSQSLVDAVTAGKTVRIIRIQGISI